MTVRLDDWQDLMDQADRDEFQATHIFAGVPSSRPEGPGTDPAGAHLDAGGGPSGSARDTTNPSRPAGSAAGVEPGETIRRNLELAAVLRDHADALEPRRRLEALRLAWHIEADLHLTTREGEH